jgi:hypothetical protein
MNILKTTVQATILFPSHAKAIDAISSLSDNRNNERSQLIKRRNSYLRTVSTSSHDDCIKLGKPNPCSAILLQKLTVPRLVQNFPSLQKSDLQYCVHKNPLQVPVLSQIGPLHPSLLLLVNPF